jgi:hypothetical protein
MVGEIASGADGLCALRHDIAAGDRLTGPDPASGGGQFWLVLAGSMLCDGTTLPPRSCVFVSPDEPSFTALAGADGLEVLALQYPRPSTV